MADAFGLSHQRVHQILRSGRPPRPSWRGSTGPRCSFCARAQADADRIIAGPGVAICEGCIGEATTVASCAVVDRAGAPAMAVVPGEVDLAPECSFCSKDRDHVEGMIVGEEARIFDKCLHLCLE
ncbi:MAG: hypothetical protein M3P97_12225, partial [Actinomycetota bacterium]|nr:hypothetical protein [Actinomycetota bacterium]